MLFSMRHIHYYYSLGMYNVRTWHAGDRSVLRTEVGIHFCLSGDDPDDPSHLIPKIRTQLAS
jgi:hypothetical protein